MTKVDPVTVLLIGILGGIGTAITYIFYRVIPTIGERISAKDLLPALPPNPPLPRFILEKPEIVTSTRDILGLK